ncbi:choice-of-anchor Q domain-containing protein [Thermopirellula anaerolimosa]
MPDRCRLSRIWAAVLAVLSLSALSSPAADFYIDPQHGDAANDGSKDRPWKSLQDVLDRGWIETRDWPSLPYKPELQLLPKNAGAPVRPGDTIHLRSGDYGDLVIRSHYNRDFITIRAEEGQTPRFRSIHIQSGSHWVLKGLHVSPEYGSGDKPRAMIFLESHGWRGPVHDIIVEDCVLQSAEDTSQWSADDWNRRACDGIITNGASITIRRNRLKNVDFGISVSGPNGLVEHNVVENFSGDGLRGLGDYGVFQYNVVKNCYDVNENHDDGFQSWSVGPDGVGTGQVKGIVLRGNVIINYEDPNQPHRGALQGIGCFDGMYVDWVVENNVVFVDHYHGITFGGAVNCRIINNTVIDPNDRRPGPAAVRIGNHKRGMPSRDCIVRNNLVSALDVRGEGMTADHNLIVEKPGEMFVDSQHGDFRLREKCPAVDAGTAEGAPRVDIRGTTRPQGDAVDIGAFEWTEEPSGS